MITKQSERKIHNIFQWTSAFMRYMKIYLLQNKKRVFQMLDYVEDIRFAATKWGGYGWRTYDKQFHGVMASSLSTKWDEINQRLWLLHITPSTMTPSTSGVGSSKGSPFPGRGSGSRPLAASWASKKAKDSRICFAFNKGRCSRDELKLPFGKM